MHVCMQRLVTCGIFHCMGVSFIYKHNTPVTLSLSLSLYLKIYIQGLIVLRLLYLQCMGRVQAVPSYKLLPLGYQMVSRLKDEPATFQKVLKKILVRLAVDHPHHMLLHVLSLTHAAPSSTRHLAAAALLDVRTHPHHNYP